MVIVGLTGSVLAFSTSIERLIVPELFAPNTAGTPLDLPTLIERGQQLDPRIQVFGVSVRDGDRAVVQLLARVDPATGKRYSLDFDQIFLDPFTGRELGRRRRGDLSQGRVNWIPFVLDLHMNLVLPRRIGGPLLGWVALLWTLDCFVALALSVPRWHTASGGAGRSWLWRWLAFWGVTPNRSTFRLNFDLHRASGLWFWVLMLMFAWSSVYLNLHHVYAPVTGAVLDYPADNNHSSTRPRLSPPLDAPPIGWREAQQRAAAELIRAGLEVQRVVFLAYTPFLGQYQYGVATTADFQTEGGRTFVLIDGRTGQLEELRLPRGQHTGLTFTNWIYALHLANVFGVPYRIVVCLSGLALTLLSVTGLYVWWKKRGFRQHIAARTQGRLPREAGASAVVQ